MLSILLLYIVTIRGDHPDVAERLGNFDSTYEQNWNEGLEGCSQECQTEYDSVADDIDQVVTGMEASTAIYNMFKSGTDKQEFEELKGLVTKVTPFLSKWVPVLSLVGSFFDSEDTLKLNFMTKVLTEGFKNLNSRFDTIESKLEDLESKLEDLESLERVEALRSKWSILEQELGVVNYHANTFLEKVGEKGLVKKDDGSDDYLVQLQINNLLQRENRQEDALIGIKKLFIEYGNNGICYWLAHELTNDRHAVMDLIMPVYWKFVQGVSDYLLIANLDGRDDDELIATEEEWFTDTEEIFNAIELCDRQMESWVEWTWRGDLVKALTPWKTIPNNVEGLAQDIYVKLSQKYYWRDWLIAVYEDSYGDENTYYWNCQGAWATAHWENIYFIIVTHVSPTKSPWAHEIPDMTYPNHERADSFWYSTPDHLRTCDYPISGVVKDGIPLATRAPDGRSYYKAVSSLTCMFICWHAWFQLFILG